MARRHRGTLQNVSLSSQKIISEYSREEVHPDKADSSTTILQVTDLGINCGFHYEEFRTRVVCLNAANLLPHSVSVKSSPLVHEESWALWEE